MVYLRDEIGNYFKVEEEIFMRLQLEEIAKVANAESI